MPSEAKISHSHIQTTFYLLNSPVKGDVSPKWQNSKWMPGCFIFKVKLALWSGKKCDLEREERKRERDILSDMWKSFKLFTLNKNKYSDKLKHPKEMGKKAIDEM